ncbi:hypothetical protein SOVF_037850 [Spinacia oleracea]|nr:hypothetical protein SOVF_037850 [Spinacia oleracea]
MAEAIIAQLVSPILEKLGSEAYKKVVYAKDLDSHIKSLQELKTTIEATLLDASSLDSCSNAQQDVLDKLRTTLTELDDFLEEQADKADLKQFKKGNKFIKPVRLFFSESNQLVSPFRDANKLKAILEKFDRIASNHGKHGNIVTVTRPSVNQSLGRSTHMSMTCSPILNDLVIGRDGERDNIVGKLADLNRLNNLSGELSVDMRRESKDIISSEITAVNLKMKVKLSKLNITFKNGTKEDERVLECLQPPPNLKLLKISGYGGERLPDWMMDGQLESHLHNLVHICISNCKSCRYLCSFGRLPYLRLLNIKELDDVEYVEENTSSNNANNNGNVVNDSPLFPSLERLDVSGMPKLKGWWRMSSSSGDQHSTELLQVQQHQNHHPANRKPGFLALFMLIVYYLKLAITIVRQLIHSFTSLEILSIFRMPILVGWWSSGEQDSRELYLLQQHQNQNQKPAFPKLKSLAADKVEFAITIAQCFGGLTSVEKLYIENKVIGERPANILLNKCFPNLNYLYFSDGVKLEVLPESIRDLSTLKTLDINSWGQLKAIPEWIDSLTSLIELRLTECPRLESLPQQISNLPNLKELYIYECPILSERCKSPDGEYWPFIKHIPRIHTD